MRSRPWGFEELAESNGDYDGTAARNPHSHRSISPEFMGEILAMRIKKGLYEASGGFEGTEAQKPHSDCSDKIKTPEFID